MKLKYYLRGLGVGVILTTVILMIASAFTPDTISDDDIIDRARDLGMIMQNEQVSGLEDAKQSQEEKDQEKQSGKEPATQKEVTPSKGEKNKDDTDEPDQQTDKKQKDSEKHPETESVAIEVIKGEYSDAISKKLFQAGLIDDSDAFNQYLIKSGSDSSLAVGVHNVPKGSTREEIVKILCEKPEDQ